MLLGLVGAGRVGSSGELSVRVQGESIDSFEYGTAPEVAAVDFVVVGIAAARLDAPTTR